MLHYARHTIIPLVMSTFNPLCMFALNEYRQLDVDNRRVIKTSLKLFVLICKSWLAAALPITGFDIIKFSSKSEIFAPPNLLIHCNSFLTVGESAALHIFYNRINGSKVLSRWPCNSAISNIIILVEYFLVGTQVSDLVLTSDMSIRVGYPVYMGSEVISIQNSGGSIWRQIYSRWRLIAENLFKMAVEC